MAATAYTLEQANTIFQNTIGHRSQVLEDRKNDPQTYKAWLEAKIEELGKIVDPLECDLQIIERYIHYWMACNVLCMERERQQRERQARLKNLIKDFEAMKNAK
jgi:hypothetical protein